MKIAINGLNEVLDEGLPLHPLEIQRNTVRDWRQIGCGIMGLADMLIKMHIKYDSEEALQLCDKIGHILATTAIEESNNLGKEKGSYNKLHPELIQKSKFYQNHSKFSTLPTLRNSQLLTIAPTGTISTMLGISGGVEPIFAIKYTRTTKSLHDKDEEYEVFTKIAKDWLDEHPGEQLPDYFVDSSTIDPLMRVRMQGTWQKHIDASISSTVNLPEEATTDDVYNIYMNAWKHGLKGITIFRQGCKRVAILNTNKSKEPIKEDSTNSVFCYDCIKPISRKTIGVTSGSTFCKKCACGTLYITINRDNAGNLVEVFTHTSKGGICAANTNALTRMVSLGLRSGIKVSEIIDQLKGITCPACLKVKAHNKELDGISCPDILSRTIEEFEKLSICQNNILTTRKSQNIVDTSQHKEYCPDCGAEIIYSEGCKTCTNCGWSKCS